MPVLNFQRKINTAYFFHARIDQAVLLWFISLLLLRFQSKEFNRQEIGFWLCGDWIAWFCGKTLWEKRISVIQLRRCNYYTLASRPNHSVSTRNQFVRKYVSLLNTTAIKTFDFSNRLHACCGLKKRLDFPSMSNQFRIFHTVWLLNEVSSAAQCPNK